MAMAIKKRIGARPSLESNAYFASQRPRSTSTRPFAATNERLEQILGQSMTDPVELHPVDSYKSFSRTLIQNRSISINPNLPPPAFSSLNNSLQSDESFADEGANNPHILNKETHVYIDMIKQVIKQDMQRNTLMQVECIWKYKTREHTDNTLKCEAEKNCNHNVICFICADRKVNVAVVPCGHMLCSVCQETYEKNFQKNRFDKENLQEILELMHCMFCKQLSYGHVRVMSFGSLSQRPCDRKCDRCNGRKIESINKPCGHCSFCWHCAKYMIKELAANKNMQCTVCEHEIIRIFRMRIEETRDIIDDATTNVPGRRISIESITTNIEEMINMTNVCCTPCSSTSYRTHDSLNDKCRHRFGQTQTTNNTSNARIQVPIRELKQQHKAKINGTLLSLDKSNNNVVARMTRERHSKSKVAILQPIREKYADTTVPSTIVAIDQCKFSGDDLINL